MNDYISRMASLDGKNCLIDLHQHLDGSISVSIAKKLAAMQNIDLPDENTLAKLLSVEPDCRDLNQYLEKFALPLSLLQTREAISESVYLLLNELQSQGLIYAEIRFAPQLHTDKELTQEEVIRAAIQGLNRGSLPGGLILCCMRGSDTHGANLETVRLAAEFLGEGVLALDLAGAEAIYDTGNYEKEFSLARQLGVPYTIHAGEADGPGSIRKAIGYGAKRIGHGVRSVEDKDLLRFLAEKGITLECCPTSNLQTQIFPSIHDFPARVFLDAGVKFTINTDNTSVSATNLRREWELVIDAFSLTDEEVKTILLNAVDAAFTGEDMKQTLRDAINSTFPMLTSV